VANPEQAFISPIPQNQTCGQSSSSTQPAAESLYVSYAYCSSKCGGIGLSKGKIHSEWAAPLVQFILLSIIFSMTIPRRKKIEFDYVFDWKRGWSKNQHFNNLIQLMISLVAFTFILLPVVVETLFWIFVIIVGPGNMLILDRQVRQ